jgi:hypothetical protein
MTVRRALVAMTLAASLDCGRRPSTDARDVKRAPVIQGKIRP